MKADWSTKAKVSAVVGGVILMVAPILIFVTKPLPVPLQSLVLYYYIAVLIALGAGTLAFFLSGKLHLSGKLPKWLTGLAIKATSGFAVFALVLLLAVLLYNNFMGSKKPITGTVFWKYEGADEKREMAVGAEVSVIGSQLEAVPTTESGFFSFANAPVEAKSLEVRYRGNKMDFEIKTRENGEYTLTLKRVASFESMANIGWTESPDQSRPPQTHDSRGSPIPCESWRRYTAMIRMNDFGEHPTAQEVTIKVEYRGTLYLSAGSRIVPQGIIVQPESDWPNVAWAFQIEPSGSLDERAEVILCSRTPGAAISPEGLFTFRRFL